MDRPIQTAKETIQGNQIQVNVFGFIATCLLALMFVSKFQKQSPEPISLIPPPLIQEAPTHKIDVPQQPVVDPKDNLTSKDLKEIECLASNIYFEARAEPIQGQIAVALVTLNRKESDIFPDTICEVVKQTRNNVCQFSWWCEHENRQQAIKRKFKEKDIYQSIKEIALSIYLQKEEIEDYTKGALFYHATYVSKSKIGVPNLQKTMKIGNHIFYRLKT